MLILLFSSLVLTNGMYWIPARIKNKYLPNLFLRRLLFLSPYLVWILSYRFSPTFHFPALVAFVALPIAANFFWRRNALRLRMNHSINQLAGEIRYPEFSQAMALWLLAACAEEIFFRHAFLSQVPTLSMVFSQAAFFALSHFATPWRQRFCRNDFASQIAIGVCFGAYYWVSEDLMACVVGHLVLNAPHVVGLAWRLPCFSAAEQYEISF